MAEQQVNDEWKDIPPTPLTTFPKIYFILYTIIALILLPISTLVRCVSGLYALIMYLVNKAFYYPANKLLKPITPSPSSYVIVTGAASGIGKDMSLIFASKSFSLILIDVSPKLEDYAKELQNKYSNQSFKHLQIDLSQTNAAKKIYNTIINEWKLFNIDILVNCAGFGLTGDFLNQNIDKVRCMVNVNSICCMELGHVFGRYFVQRGKGRICQIASVAAFYPGSHSAAYHATKSFIRNWAIAFQHELLGTGVGVTVVCPGPVRTNFMSKSNSDKALVFGALSWFNYKSIDVANAAVNATLQGKREIIYGPLWNFLQTGLGYNGEAFNIIAAKLLWQDPNSTYRSPYDNYKHN
eukprot:337195_1